MWTNMAGIMAATVLVQNSHSKSDTSYIFFKSYLVLLKVKNIYLTISLDFSLHRTGVLSIFLPASRVSRAPRPIRLKNAKK